MDAEIIAFPRQRTTSDASDDASDGNARLLRALRGLDAALAEQRTAIAAWRASLSRLQETVHGMSDGLQRYRGSLDSLHTGVTRLNGQARQLESWADSVLAAESDAEGRA